MKDIDCLHAAHPKMPDWPHSPIHRLSDAGAYIVTAGTYGKHSFFGSPERLTFLCATLLKLAQHYGWNLQAWAVLSNHYHIVAISPATADSLKSFIRHLHSLTAREINAREKTPGRKVWFEYWESRLTYERSYYARLSYVHHNAVHHGLVRVPSAYPWCSASWFERRAQPAFYNRIMHLPYDHVRVPDDFHVGASSLLPL